jgi:streptogramin lyase
MKTIASALLATALSAGAVQAQSLWASDSATFPNPVIYELDANTGAVISTIDGPGTFVDALSFANDGNSIWTLDSNSNSDVYQIDLAGNVLKTFFVPLDAEGLTILADGSLVIAGGSSNLVAFVNPANGVILSSFSVGTFIAGLASNGTDRLFGLTIGGDILTYDLSGNLLSTLVTDVPGTTLGLAATPDGGYYISATGSRIYRVNAAGITQFSFAGPNSFTEGLDFPQGIQVEPEPTPAPATLAILGLGFGLLVAARRRA